MSSHLKRCRAVRAPLRPPSCCSTRRMPLCRLHRPLGRAALRWMRPGPAIHHKLGDPVVLSFEQADCDASSALQGCFPHARALL
eukprot:3141663-Alexandrium_andersonii.AAC.1